MLRPNTDIGLEAKTITQILQLLNTYQDHLFYELNAACRRKPKYTESELLAHPDPIHTENWNFNTLLKKLHAVTALKNVFNDGSQKSSVLISEFNKTLDSTQPNYVATLEERRHKLNPFRSKGYKLVQDMRNILKAAKPVETKTEIHAPGFLELQTFYTTTPRSTAAFVATALPSKATYDARTHDDCSHAITEDPALKDKQIYTNILRQLKQKAEQISALMKNYSSYRLGASWRGMRDALLAGDLDGISIKHPAEEHARAFPAERANIDMIVSLFNEAKVLASNRTFKAISHNTAIADAVQKDLARNEELALADERDQRTGGLLSMLRT